MGIVKVFTLSLTVVSMLAAKPAIYIYNPQGWQAVALEVWNYALCRFMVANADCRYDSPNHNKDCGNQDCVAKAI